jgi:hypothetical protein
MRLLHADSEQARVLWHELCERLQELQQHFEPVTDNQRQHVGDTLPRIIANYILERRRAERMQGWDTHRDRIASIIAAAARLRSCLENEPLISDLFRKRSISGDWEEQDYTDQRLAKFLETLGVLAANSSTICAEPDFLRLLRGDPNIIGRHRKSAERFELWEPLLQLWWDCGKKAGAARSGKLVKLISEIHHLIGIPAPKPESLYRTIRDWNCVEQGGHGPGLYKCVNPLRKRWGN